MRTEIRSHTGLRGIAALFVVGYHQQFTAGYKLPFEVIFPRSYLMVDLFFVLSGFVLSYVYCERINVRSFYRARFARIYPLHVFALLAFTILIVGVSAMRALAGRGLDDFGPLSDWLSQLFLLNAWIPAQNEWNKPSWSISAEAFAYLLFPLAVAALSIRPRLVSIAMVAGAVTFYALIGSSLDISVGLAPLRCLAGFGLGMALFQFRNLPVKAISQLQLAAVVWIVGALILPVYDALIMPGFAALVFLTWRDQGLVAKALSARPLHRLGELSYSIYLMHYTAGGLVGMIWIRTVAKLGMPSVLERSLFLACVFAVVVAVSALTYRFIERPFQEFLRGRSPKTEVAPAAP